MVKVMPDCIPLTNVYNHRGIIIFNVLRIGPVSGWGASPYSPTPTTCLLHLHSSSHTPPPFPFSSAKNDFTCSYITYRLLDQYHVMVETRVYGKVPEIIRHRFNDAKGKYLLHLSNLGKPSKINLVKVGTLSQQGGEGP